MPRNKEKGRISDQRSAPRSQKGPSLEVYHEDRSLTLLFDTRNPEEVESLHHWRASFGPVTDLEAVNEFMFALHIRPGTWCWENSKGAA